MTSDASAVAGAVGVFGEFKQALGVGDRFESGRCGGDEKGEQDGDPPYGRARGRHQQCAHPSRDFAGRGGEDDPWRSEKGCADDGAGERGGDGVAAVVAAASSSAHRSVERATAAGMRYSNGFAAAARRAIVWCR